MICLDAADLPTGVDNPLPDPTVAITTPGACCLTAETPIHAYRFQYASIGTQREKNRFVC